MHLPGTLDSVATQTEVLRRMQARLAKRTFKWAIDKLECDPTWVPTKPRHLELLQRSIDRIAKKKLQGERDSEQT